MRKYFTGSGATIYTWTSDRHAQYGTRIIPTTVREATYVLDAIFDNETSLTIGEHTTDTAGYTDLVFGLFDLTGLRFSPRIRDLANQRLWRLPTTPTNQPAAKLLRQQINPRRFVEHWDTMLRAAATIRHGHLPASLWSSPHVLDTWFMRPCDGSSCPPIRLVAGSRWWSGAGGGCTRLRSSTGLIGGRGGGSGSCFG